MSRTIANWELSDLGIEHSQYFQGFGTSHTGFEFSAYGIGENPAEALDDCLEQVAQQGFDTEALEREIAEQFPSFADAAKNDAASVTAHLESFGEEQTEECELYYHIGIRWNAPPDLASMDAWKIAEHFKCNYTGDANPIEYDGTFYSAKDWAQFDYASAVQFSNIEGRLLVSCGTIHKPSKPADLSAALACCDVPADLRDKPEAQIEACLFYFGAEPSEDFSGRFEQWFEPDSDGNLDESAIWESVNGWLTELGN